MSALLAILVYAQVILTIVEAPRITSQVLGRVQPGDVYSEWRGNSPVFSTTGINRRVDLTFTTEMGRNYVVESIAESAQEWICNYYYLATNSYGIVSTGLWLTVTYYQWVPVSPPIAGTGGTVAFRHGAFGTNRFYRIKKI